MGKDPDITEWLAELALVESGQDRPHHAQVATNAKVEIERLRDALRLGVLFVKEFGEDPTSFLEQAKSLIG